MDWDNRNSVINTKETQWTSYLLFLGAKMETWEPDRHSSKRAIIQDRPSKE